MMSARGAFPLFLLLLAWTLPTRVHCQEVTVSRVSTQYVEVEWVKHGKWMGVDYYQVKFTAEGSRDCLKNVSCFTVNCNFNSVLCGQVDPCTPTTTTISGADYSAPNVSLITGPEQVIDFDSYLEEGVEYISWVNPSTNSSPCYENTAVKVTFNHEESTDYFDLDEESTSKPLCVEGYGTVEVWTRGGDGISTSSKGNIAYTDPNVVDLVTFERCEPMGCTGMMVEWTYVPVCPDVAYLEIAMDDVRQNVSIDVTNQTLTGLEVDEEYSTYIYARGKDGRTLDYDSHFYCETAREVPENLAAEALSRGSLHVTWDPPVCPKNPQIEYELRVDYTDYTTTATTYDVQDLRSFYEYEVRLSVVRDGYDSGETVTTHALTLPPAPNLYEPHVYQDAVEVYWYFYVSNSHGYEFYYKVTWGTSLQHKEETKEEKITIKGFNNTDEVFKVCVAAVPQGREDLTGPIDCKYVTDPGVLPTNSMSGGMIAGIVCVILFLAVVVVIVSVTFRNKMKSTTRHRQQQQQQQQQQQYNHGMYNYGANT